MKLTAMVLKKLIQEELENIKESNNIISDESIEIGMHMITPQQYEKALKDPKTQEALSKIAKQLNLTELKEETGEEYAERKDKARLKAKISDAVQMAAGSSAIFTFNAGIMLGTAGASLVSMAGVGALAGLLLYYLGGFGNQYDAYKYSKLVNPETGEREEKTYDPMDKVIKETKGE
jgi:hypothetical protein